MAIRRASRPNIPSEIGSDNGASVLKAIIFALDSIVISINGIVDYINKNEAEWKNNE